MSRSSKRTRVLLLSAVAATLLLSACAGTSKSTTGSAAAKGKSEPLQKYQMARMYFEQNKIPEALEAIDKSIKQDDSLPQTHFYKGFIYWNLEDCTKAMPEFQRAIELHEYYTMARMYLSTCYETEGLIDQALAQLDIAQRDRTYPTPEKIHLNRAMIFKRKGRLTESLEQLRQAVERSRNYYRAHLEMAKVLEDLGRGAEALDAYAAAEPGYDEDAEYHYLLGSALFRADRVTEARKHLRRAIDLAPGSRTAEKARELLGVLS